MAWYDRLSSSDDSGESFLWRAVAVFLVWTAVATVLAVQFATTGGTTGLIAPIGTYLPHFLVFYWLWALLTPAVLFVARRATPARMGWPLSIATHIGAAAAIVGLHTVIYVPLVLWLWPTISWHSMGWHIANALRRHGPGSLLTYAAVATGWYVLDHRRRIREQATQARLDALTAQLQPHFLFNSLQLVSTLMHQDVHAADATLTRLSDFLRATLRRDGRLLVPLGEELALLEHYVAVMRGRFGERLAVHIDAPAVLRDALVPVLVLQPIVENAIQHGVAKRAGARRIDVTARQREGSLVLTVTDDGPGRQPATASDGRGIGLRNTATRLEELFGARQRLLVEDVAGGGVRVTIELPYAEGAATAPPA